MNLVGLDRKTLQETLYMDADKQRLVEAVAPFFGAKDRTILAEWLRRDKGDVTSVWAINVSTRQVLGDEDSVPVSVTTSVVKSRKRKTSATPAAATAAAAAATAAAVAANAVVADSNASVVTKTRGDDDYVPPGEPDEKRPKKSSFQSLAEDGDSVINADTTDAIATKQ